MTLKIVLPVSRVLQLKCKCDFQELDITATDIGKECLMDVLTRIPAIRWLSAGQLDAMTDNVMKVKI